MIRFLNLRQQYLEIKDEIDAAIHAVLSDATFVGGRYVQTFEAEFAAYQSADYCVGVANGTDAIEIAIEVLDLPPQSEIVVPANSFIATAEAVTRMGHRVVFCDCDPGTYTLSANDLGRRITPRTAAVIPVHLYGQPCDMDAILAVARRHALRVIEDCAQAHGAEYHGRRVGTLGDIGTFSFYPGKNIGAYGDAGAIVTNDGAIAERARMIANHGRVEKYNHLFEGRNSRLDGLQAAILSVKLRYIEEWTETRILLAHEYRRLLAGCSDLVLPEQMLHVRHVYHLFVVRTRRRDKLKQYLADRGVETGIHYPVALPKLAAYAYLGPPEKMFANSVGDELLSLPIGEHLTHVEVQRVTEVVESFFLSTATTTFALGEKG